MSNIRFFERSICGKSLAEKLTIVKDMLDSFQLKPGISRLEGYEDFELNMLQHLFDYLNENPELLFGLEMEHRRFSGKFRCCHRKLLHKLYSSCQKIWDERKFLSCIECHHTPQIECRFKCIHMFQYMKDQADKSH